MRKLLTAVLGVGLLFLLTSCFKIEANIQVHEDNTVSGYMISGLSKKVMEKYGDEMNMDDTSNEDFPKGSKVEDWEDSNFVGKKATFSDVPLSEFDSNGDTIKREGDKFVMTLTSEDTGTDELSGDQMAQAIKLFGDPEVSMVFEFPGKITKHTGPGTVDGNKLSLNLDDLMANEDIVVEANAKPDSTSPLLWVGIGVLLLMGAAVAVAMVVIKRGNGGSAVSTEEPAPPTLGPMPTAPPAGFEGQQPPVAPPAPPATGEDRPLPPGF